MGGTEPEEAESDQYLFFKNIFVFFLHSVPLMWQPVSDTVEHRYH